MTVYVTGDIHSRLAMDSLRSWKQGEQGDYLIAINSLDDKTRVLEGSLCSPLRDDSCFFDCRC